MAAQSDTAAAAPEVRDKQARARYDAFISYSHHSDARLAPLLQAGLHRFAKPWYRMRAVRVFRDEASLAATLVLLVLAGRWFWRRREPLANWMSDLWVRLANAPRFAGFRQRHAKL